MQRKTPMLRLLYSQISSQTMKSYANVGAGSVFIFDKINAKPLAFRIKEIRSGQRQLPHKVRAELSSLGSAKLEFSSANDAIKFVMEVTSCEFVVKQTSWAEGINSVLKDDNWKPTIRNLNDLLSSLRFLPSYDPLYATITAKLNAIVSDKDFRYEVSKNISKDMLNLVQALSFPYELKTRKEEHINAIVELLNRINCDSNNYQLEWISKLPLSLKSAKGSTDVEKKLIKSITAKLLQYVQILKNLQVPYSELEINEKSIGRMALGIKSISLSSSEAQALLKAYSDYVNYIIPLVKNLTIDNLVKFFLIVSACTGSSPAEQQLLKSLGSLFYKFTESHSMSTNDSTLILKHLSFIGPSIKRFIETTDASKAIDLVYSVVPLELATSQFEDFLFSSMKFYTTSVYRNSVSSAALKHWLEKTTAIVNTNSKNPINQLGTLLAPLSYLKFESVEELVVLRRLHPLLEISKFSEDRSKQNNDKLEETSELEDCLRFLRQTSDVEERRIRKARTIIINHIKSFSGLTYKTTINKIFKLLSSLHDLCMRDHRILDEVAKVLSSDPTYDKSDEIGDVKDIFDFLSIVQGLKHEEKIISVASHIIRTNNISMTSKTVLELMWSLRSMHERSKSSNDYTDVVRTLITPFVGKPFAPGAVANIYVCMQCMTGKNMHVRQLLEVVAKLVNSNPAPQNDWTSKMLSKSLFGLQNLRGDTLGERQVIKALVDTLKRSTLKNLDGADIGKTLYGLQNLNYKEMEVLELIALIAGLLQNSTGNVIKSDGLLNACNGIRKLDSTLPETRTLLFAFTSYLAKCKPCNLSADDMLIIKEGIENSKDPAWAGLQSVLERLHVNKKSKLSEPKAKLDGTNLGEHNDDLVNDIDDELLEDKEFIGQLGSLGKTSELK